MSEEAFIYEAIRTPARQNKERIVTFEVKPLSLVVGWRAAKRHPDDENLISTSSAETRLAGDQGGGIARRSAGIRHAGRRRCAAQPRFCASGLEAVSTTAQKVRSAGDDLVLAGGVRSMKPGC